WFRLLVDIARSGSLSAAARKHGISQPAVSYQIRQLEAAFGVALLHRQHRGVTLTEEGEKVLQVVEKAVTEIDQLVVQFHDRFKRPALRLCTDYAFATLWLIPRMHRFRQLYPDFDIQIMSAQRLEPEWAEDAEVAVAFGTRQQFGQLGQMILAERVRPICANALLQRFAGQDPGTMLSRAPLIHLESVGSSPWFDWSRYLASVGQIHQQDPGAGDFSFNNYPMVVQAALGGQGLALGWAGLIDHLLATGMLVTAGPELADPERGYWLLRSGSTKAGVQGLVDWIMQEATSGSGD
ncbi:MAG TPA: LysR family transcriptional regulator, partial [Pseudorhizobium sp.]|nr:LysR family transcriptional regulator [Pseudorhizobium sp.]